jgi:predicted glycoside hydrolase/deacetylase ChbG (UPF0249 family)
MVCPNGKERGVPLNSVAVTGGESAPGRRRTLVIVNADDYGLDRESTDATLRCFRAGRVSSASALVYMADADRGAELARDVGLDVGLHLNLTEPYADSSAPGSARERQLRLTQRFSGRGLRLMRWIYDPLLRSDVEDCIADQIERFQLLYGRSPSHFDGHRHVHMCPNVALARTLPPTAKLRRSLRVSTGSAAPVAVLRAARNGLVDRRFVTTDRLVELARLETDHAARAVLMAGDGSIEVLCHPAFAEELEILMSEWWARVMDECHLGSFASLSR